MGSQPSKTTTTVSNAPPAYHPAIEPYIPGAIGFYGKTLEDPPVYPGQRIAPISAGQDEYINQTYGYFGAPQPYQLASEEQVGRTAAGGYANSFQDPYGVSSIGGAPELGDAPGLGSANIDTSGTTPIGAKSAYRYQDFPQYAPMSKEQREDYIQSASEPIYRDLEEVTMRNIRDSSQIHGGGATSTRGDVAREQALVKASEQVSNTVLAPMILQEQQLQQDFAKAIQALEQAKGEGDANRATQASIAAGQIKTQLASVQAQIYSTQAQYQASTYGTKAGYLASTYGTETGAKTAAANRALGAHEGERGRMLQAAGMTPSMLAAEAFRTGQLRSAGDYEQDLYQRILNAQRAAWEEPYKFQDKAAASILGAGQPSASGGTSNQITDQGEDVMGSVMQVAMMAIMAYAMMGSSETIKTGIEELDDIERKKLSEDILNLDVKRWKYIFDPHKEHYGPILEEMPERFHLNKLYVDIPTLIGGLVTTVQQQQKELNELKALISQTTV